MKNESSTKPLNNILVKHFCTKFVRFGLMFVRGHLFKMSVSPQTSNLYALLYAIVVSIFVRSHFLCFSKKNVGRLLGVLFLHIFHNKTNYF